MASGFRSSIRPSVATAWDRPEGNLTSAFSIGPQQLRQHLPEIAIGSWFPSRSPPVIAGPVPQPGRGPLGHVLRIADDDDTLLTFAPPHAEFEEGDDGTQLCPVARMF